MKKFFFFVVSVFIFYPFMLFSETMQSVLEALVEANKNIQATIPAYANHVEKIEHQNNSLIFEMNQPGPICFYEPKSVYEASTREVIRYFIPISPGKAESVIREIKRVIETYDVEKDGIEIFFVTQPRLGIQLVMKRESAFSKKNVGLFDSNIIFSKLP